MLSSFFSNINSYRNSNISLNSFRCNNYKYLGILEAETTRQTEMKEKIRKEYIRRTKNFLKSNSCP